MNSLHGLLLIASPELRDPNFYRSVVLVVEHSTQGAMGVILNRPTTTPVSSAWKELGKSPCTFDGLLHLGGPCEGPLMALHGVDSLTQIPVTAGVHFSGREESIEQLVAMHNVRLKLIVGYAGWGAGQLEDEIREGAWKLLPAEDEHVFSDQGNLWQTSLQQATRKALLNTLGIRRAPDDASLN